MNRESRSLVGTALVIGLMLLAGMAAAEGADPVPGRFFDVVTDKAVYTPSQPVLLLLKYVNASAQSKFLSVQPLGNVIVRRATAPVADPTLAFTGSLTPVTSLDLVSTPRPMPAPVYSIGPAASKVVAYMKIPARTLRPGVYMVRLWFQAVDPFSPADSPGLQLQTVIEVVDESSIIGIR